MGDRQKSDIILIEDIKKLSEIYNIPFMEILDIIKRDRELALENYRMFKERMEDSQDDTDSTKEQVNRALNLVIQSSCKLSDLIHSASRLWGDTIKAMAIRESRLERKFNERAISEANSSRRSNLIDSLDGVVGDDGKNVGDDQ